VVALGDARPIDVLTPGVMALAVLSTSFTSVAIATGFERRYGVLKRLGASPLPRTALLAGKVAAVLLVETLQLSLVAAVGLGLGWQPRGGLPSALGAALLVALGTAAFCALGLLMAGILRAEATLAAANLVYLLLLAGGGVIVPIDRYPDSAAAHLGLLPSGALARDCATCCRGPAWARARCWCCSSGPSPRPLSPPGRFDGSDAADGTGAGMGVAGRQRAAGPEWRGGAAHRIRPWDVRPGRSAPTSRWCPTVSWACTEPSSSATGCWGVALALVAIATWVAVLRCARLLVRRGAPRRCWRSGSRAGPARWGSRCSPTSTPGSSPGT
jgi:hypothetical protein